MCLLLITDFQSFPWTVIGERSAHNPLENAARRYLTETTSTPISQGLSDYRLDKAGSRKSGHNHPTCDYKSAKQETMRLVTYISIFFCLHNLRLLSELYTYTFNNSFVITTGPGISLLVMDPSTTSPRVIILRLGLGCKVQPLCIGILTFSSMLFIEDIHILILVVVRREQLNINPYSLLHPQYTGIIKESSQNLRLQHLLPVPRYDIF
jgi:hypothetical protein